MEIEKPSKINAKERGEEEEQALGKRKKFPSTPEEKEL